MTYVMFKCKSNDEKYYLVLESCFFDNEVYKVSLSEKRGEMYYEIYTSRYYTKSELKLAKSTYNRYKKQYNL